MFAAEEGNLHQVIRDRLQIDVPIKDVAAISENDEQIDRIIDQEASALFDLEKGPLFRIKILKLGTDRHMILFTMHHIISDGWSIGVIINEAVVAYSAIIRSQEPELPALKVQYKDFAAWQQERLEKGDPRRSEGVLAGKTERPALGFGTSRRQAQASHTDQQRRCFQFHHRPGDNDPFTDLCKRTERDPFHGPAVCFYRSFEQIEQAGGYYRRHAHCGKKPS